MALNGLNCAAVPLIIYSLTHPLGVLVSQHLTFSEHIDSIVRKAAYRSYLVFKCFQSRNTKLLVQALTTYMLEVNSQVWSPHLLKDIRRSEAEQCRFTKKLLVMHSFTYRERLKLLGLERLEDRRLRADILFVYKLLFGLTALQADDFFIWCESTCTIEAIHSYKLFYRDIQSDVRKCFFLPPHRENLE